METARDSSGSAMKEFDTWSESLAGHLGELQAKWEAFSTNIADSTGLKVLIDLGSTAVTVLDKLTDVFGSFGMIALPIVASMSKLGDIGELKYALLWRVQPSHRMLAA